jgi:hypothetical protein
MLGLLKYANGILLHTNTNKHTHTCSLVLFWLQTLRYKISANCERNEMSSWAAPRIHTYHHSLMFSNSHVVWQRNQKNTKKLKKLCLPTFGNLNSSPPAYLAMVLSFGPPACLCSNMKLLDFS